MARISRRVRDSRPGGPFEYGPELERELPRTEFRVVPVEPVIWAPAAPLARRSEAMRSRYFRSLLPRVRRSLPSRIGVSWVDLAMARHCAARKIRREVLFSLRRAGFGGSARKSHYRRTQYSQYRC